jgi:hypothetical protein
MTEALVTRWCVWISVSPAKERGTRCAMETGRAVRVGCKMDQSNDLDYYRSSERPREEKATPRRRPATVRRLHGQINL